MNIDTICAIGTPPGRGAIACVRVSGPDVKEIIRKITGRSLKPRYASLCIIRDPETGEKLDEAICIFYEAPGSYTGEDMLEIFCHGGYIVPNIVLKAVVKSGARPALPGEFTKRAFINGKMDLVQAEAVEAIISAKDEYTVKTTFKAMEGNLSLKLKELREEILAISAELNVELDYPEEIEIDSSHLEDRLKKLLEKIKNLLTKSRMSLRFSTGVNMVIVGKPNVGKSSLLNKFLDEERVIVTDEPGTTRDVVSEWLEIDNTLVKIADTAGIRDTFDKVEGIGVQKSLEALKKADLILFVIDASTPLDENDHRILREIKNLEKEHLVVINKIDIVEKVNPKEIVDDLGTNAHVVTISALKGEGIEELKYHVSKALKRLLERKPDALLFNARQMNALEKCGEAVEEAVKSLKMGYPNDVVALELGRAARSIDQLLGLDYTEDLIDRIFSTFCVGK